MKQKQPGAFYGANVKNGEQVASGVGDDRPSGSPRHMESTMNTPRQQQVPVEGAVTGPGAPPAEVDAIYAQANLDDLSRT